MSWPQGDLHISPPSRSQLQQLQELAELGGDEHIRLQPLRAAVLILNVRSNKPAALSDLQGGKGVRILDDSLGPKEFRVQVVHANQSGRSGLSHLLQVKTSC